MLRVWYFMETFCWGECDLLAMCLQCRAFCFLSLSIFDINSFFNF